MAEQVLPIALEERVMSTLRAADLKSYAAALLTAGGFAQVHAEKTADILVWANARGADSHGVLRIPRYIEMVELGKIDPSAIPVIEKRSGSVAVLDAMNAPGAFSMTAAMDEAIDLASQFSIGWCSAQNITHAGAVGYYALQAAMRGYVGIVMTASGPLMAYHGARVSGVSTNPISIGAPSSGRPLLLDMSTSTVALGKIMFAKDAGKQIPEGWGIDANGTPVTDPQKVATVTPLGGPKGSGLSLMIEVLSSVLIGNPVISKALSGQGGSMNGVAMALNISAFSNPDSFADQIATLAASIKSLPKAEGTDAILMPGERGFLLSEARNESGIPVAEGTLKRLSTLAERFGVEAPAVYTA
ncbi:Ldh family oxidoreductase [Roseibium algae]|uniref:Ldh family oxidoreductase n=1 Tax=Roseibium algae TaxID=3123038 RepID=A0ABU8TPN0_9HYPH